MPRLGVPIDDPALRGGRDDLRSLLGGKGAGLVELSGLGIPVPPAFVLTTAAYHRWRETGDLGFLAAVLRDGLAGLEQRLDRTLGGARRPLVVSVRSGAAQSMPGMMDTVLNLGLNEQTAAALAREWGEGVAQAALARLHRSYEAIVGRLLPSDPLEQIEGAVAAVFASWDSERARTYRARGGIPDSLGTAATIQGMVFGTAPGFSGTGVMFTRHPSTGEPVPMGDWLAQAQGEDVVAGTHRTEPLTALADSAPELWSQLVGIADRLELHVQDMCDIEFTIESGKLWILQYRRGKRSPLAAVRIAIDLASDARFAVQPADAVRRIEPETVAALLAERSAGQGAQALAAGLGASPGIATGRACFSVDAALDRAELGEDVILVRPETSPDDIPGMDVARGILTSTGGLVSHAAIVAREWCKPAVVGLVQLVFTRDAASIAGQAIAEGDELTIDGATGQVFLGKVETASSQANGPLDELVQWARAIVGGDDPDPAAVLAAAREKLNHGQGERP